MQDSSVASSLANRSLQQLHGDLQSGVTFVRNTSAYDAEQIAEGRVVRRDSNRKKRTTTRQSVESISSLLNENAMRALGQSEDVFGGAGTIIHPPSIGPKSTLHYH